MIPIYIAGLAVVAVIAVCVTFTMITMIRVQAAERRDLYTRIQCRDINDYNRAVKQVSKTDTNATLAAMESAEEKAIDEWLNMK